MKKFTILGGLMALALVIGMAASSFGTGKAEATVKSAIMFNPDVCFALTLTADQPWETMSLDDYIAANTDSPADLAAYFGSMNCYGLRGYDVGVGEDLITPWLSSQLQIHITGVADLYYPPVLFTPNPDAGSLVTVHGIDALGAIADLLGGDVDNPDTYASLVAASDGQVGDHSYVHDYDAFAAICDGDDTACIAATHTFGTFIAGEGVFGPTYRGDAFDGLLGIFLGLPLATINSQSEWVLAFPSNDDAVRMEAPEGVFLHSHGEDTTVRVQDMCDEGTDCEFVAVDLLFAGCELNSGDSGDVVCDESPPEWDRTDMDLGPQQLDVYQTDNNSPDVLVDYTIVGHPENIALTSLKSTITAAAGAGCSLADVTDELGLPDVTLLIAKITDNNKNGLTGLWVLWGGGDKDVGSGAVKLAAPVDVSIKSDAGDAAVNLACGKGTGSFDVHAGVWWPQDLTQEDAPVAYVDTEGVSVGLTIAGTGGGSATSGCTPLLPPGDPNVFKCTWLGDDTPAYLCPGSTSLGSLHLTPTTSTDELTSECAQPDADDEPLVVDLFIGGPFFSADMYFEDTHPTDVTTITVIGGPKNVALSVAPPSIVCNGTNTAVVSATVTNAAGKPVPGISVQFDVVALGTANPINAVTDANGVAKSTITPIGNVTAGVTVIVTVDGLNPVSTVVGCQAQALPTQAPPPPIVGPNTGDGGYLP